MKRVRILLADRHALLLDALTCFLSEAPDIEILGRAKSGSEALSLAGMHRPDLVVIDFALSGRSGLDVTRRLTSELWAPRVVVMSFHEELPYRLAAEAAGADGFVLKQDLVRRILPLIRSLM